MLSDKMIILREYDLTDYSPYEAFVFLEQMKRVTVADLLNGMKIRPNEQGLIQYFVIHDVRRRLFKEEFCVRGFIFMIDKAKAGRTIAEELFFNMKTPHFDTKKMKWVKDFNKEEDD